MTVFMVNPYIFTSSSPPDPVEVTLTGFGGIASSNTQAKWGTASLYMDQVDDYIESNINIAIGNVWTLECWYYPGGFLITPLFGSLNATWYCNYAYGDDIAFNIGGGGWNASCPREAWHFCAITYDGATLRFYVDGFLVQSYSASLNITDTASPFAIGRSTFGDSYGAGFIQDIRVSVGVARYTGASMTAPTAPFPTDGSDPHWSNVAILIPFQETSGATSWTAYRGIS